MRGSNEFLILECLVHSRGMAFSNELAFRGWFTGIRSGRASTLSSFATATGYSLKKNAFTWEENLNLARAPCPRYLSLSVLGKKEKEKLLGTALRPN